MRYRWILWIAAGSLAGCGGNTLMLVSQDQEIEIGQEVAGEAEQQYGRRLDDGPYVARLQRVGRPMLTHVKRNVPYSLRVIDERGEVNAFACPGGPVYVLSGLMDQMDNDGELAFVIGHELSHIEFEHGRQAINQALLLNAAASAILGDADELVKFGAQAAFTLYSRGYSRDHEREADSGGLALMVASGWNPRLALSALRKLGGDEQHGPAKYLSSHPSTPERVRRLEAEIQRSYGG
jgi:predicted Zn-dependent protease